MNNNSKHPVLLSRAVLGREIGWKFPNHIIQKLDMIYLKKTHNNVFNQSPVVMKTVLEKFCVDIWGLRYIPGICQDSNTIWNLSKGDQPRNSEQEAT
jgi:hypothetical protein